jgi:glutathione S-transferase
MRDRAELIGAHLERLQNASVKGAHMDQKLILHEYTQSGNCYKIRLTAALLGLPIERREYDIMKGETRTPEFLANVNANGRIPVLQIGDRFLPESNAACFYLADGSHLIPSDRFDQADMLHWMFFEQYNHEPNVATLRFWLAFVGQENLSEAQRAQIGAKRAAGEAALKLMDEHLAGHDWFVGGGLTLADVALYAYTHVAGDGGFDLKQYPAVGRWLDRVAAQPNYVPIA